MLISFLEIGPEASLQLALLESKGPELGRARSQDPEIDCQSSTEQLGYARPKWTFEDRMGSYQGLTSEA